jgi:hypothetical protein
LTYAWMVGWSIAPGIQHERIFADALTNIVLDG